MSDRGIVGVPRVPAGMLDRARLRDRIGRAPLTVVRGPGGSGKTVLLAQWAADRPAEGAWVTVEPDTGSRLSFWTNVVDSLAHLKDGLLLPAEDGTDRDALRGALLRTFRSLDVPVVLVIDDAHELRDPLVLDDLLVLLRSSRGVSAVVGTRTRTALEAEHEALTLDIAVLAPEELVLTADEVEGLVGAGGSRFGSTTELLEASGGSPLLLRAILAGSPSADDASVPGLIAGYLRSLFQQRPQLEGFASATAIPDELDADAAERLSGLDLAAVASMLDSLEADGLVMRRQSGGVARYRYHPLVREVLRDGLRRRDGDRFRAVSLLASADAEAHRQFIPALRHAVEAEDYLRASDVCLHGGFSLLRARGAAAILEDVPLRYVARLPFLAMVLGLAANARGERLRALELLALALGASRAWRRSQRPAEQAGLALIESAVLRITGRASDAVAPARRMLAILDRSPAEELDEIADQLGSYWYQGALSLFRAGRLSEARIAAERVGVSAESLAAGAPETIGAASLIAAIDAALGECRSSAQVIERIEADEHPVELMDGYAGSLAHLARGILALESNDAAAAARQLAVFGVRPMLEHGPLFTALRGFVLLWEGAPEEALRALDQREAKDRPRARMTAQDRHVTAVLRALLHAAVGRLAQSRAALRELDRRHPLAAISEATLLILEQRPADALERLTAQAVWPGPRLQASAELLTACASLMRDDDDLATDALRRYLATSAVHGLGTPLLLAPQELRAPLAALAERFGADPGAVAGFAEVPAPLRLVGTRAVLTPRESDVLEELRGTGSLAEIASNLSVSANTVKSQLRSLYRKLEASNRDEALRSAYLQGLLDD